MKLEETFFLNSLEHWCVPEHDHTFNIHPAPRLQECPKCRTLLGDEIAERNNLPADKAPCPKCGATMEKQPPQESAELGFSFCYSKYNHYPEWFRKGKITKAEFEQWRAGLSPRARLGFEDNPKLLRFTVKIAPEIWAIKQQYPAEFQTIVNELVIDRLEVSFEKSVQTIYVVSEEKDYELLRGLPKGE